MPGSRAWRRKSTSPASSRMTLGSSSARTLLTVFMYSRPSLSTSSSWNCCSSRRCMSSWPLSPAARASLQRSASGVMPMRLARRILLRISCSSARLRLWRVKGGAQIPHTLTGNAARLSPPRGGSNGRCHDKLFADCDLALRASSCCAASAAGVASWSESLRDEK